MVKINDLLAQTRRLYETIYRFDAQAADQLGLHVTDLRCVNALESGPLSAGDIGTRLSLSSGSVTALINRLGRAGYIERLADADDARRVIIVLSRNFYSRADAVYRELGLSIRGSFGEMSDADLVSAVCVIERLADGFNLAATTVPVDRRPDLPG
jgi:DNA-binding MarR family transcriptional regulator